MEIAKVQVNGNKAVRICRHHPITAGMVGATVSFFFSPEWDGLQKTVVFRRKGDDLVLDVLNIDSEVTIPAEIVASHGFTLEVGVYGVNAAGDLVIPTTWAELDRVRDAADPSGDESTDPTLPVWVQILKAIGVLEELNTEARSNLVAAINEVLEKADGTVDEKTVQDIVDEYLAKNPPAANKDGVSWNNLTDKPFGSEMDTFTFLENSRVSSVGALEGNPENFVTERHFTAGDTVNILWNGKEYAGVARDYEQGAAVMVITEDSGEEGLFIHSYTNYPDMPRCDVYCNTSGTLSVFVTHEKVWTLDSKYLPCDGVIESNTIPAYTNTGSITIAQFDFDHIKEKFLSGEEVCFMFHAVFNYGDDYEVWVKSSGVSYNSGQNVLSILFHAPHNYHSSFGGSSNLTISVDSTGQVVDVNTAR